MVYAMLSCIKPSGNSFRDPVEVVETDDAGGGDLQLRMVGHCDKLRALGDGPLLQQLANAEGSPGIQECINLIQKIN
jgi:hypothetical protein